MWVLWYALIIAWFVCNLHVIMYIAHAKSCVFWLHTYRQARYKPKLKKYGETACSLVMSVDTSSLRDEFYAAYIKVLYNGLV